MESEVVLILRSALQRSGLTARQVAQRTGIAEGRVSDYLHARHTPGAAQLLLLLRATHHAVELVPDRSENGFVLAELLDLADAYAVDAERPLPAGEPPLFSDLLRRG